MLLVHVLFFLLLGSSVGALPFNHGPHFRPHLEEFCIDHRGGYAKSEGAESGVICHWHDPHFSPLQLTGIERHAGLWYREPTKDRYNIIEICVEGTIRFHEMGKQPGEVIRHSDPYIYLTNDNRGWLVGTAWSRMPSAKLPIPLRDDKMSFTLEDGVLRYSVRGRLVPNLPAIEETSNPIIRITLFPIECKGTWVREITKGTHEDYANDVLVIMEGGSAQIFRLGSKPGEILKEQQNIYPQRAVGIWYKMPDALTDPDHFFDCMVIYRNKEGVLVQEVYRTPVHGPPRRYYPPSRRNDSM